MAVNKNEQSLERVLGEEMIKYMLASPQSVGKSTSEVEAMKKAIRQAAGGLASDMLKDLDLDPTFSDNEKAAIPGVAKPISTKTPAPAPAQPAGGADAGVLAAAAGTTNNHYYGGSDASSDGGSSSDEWGVCSYLLLAAAAGAVCYGGYKLFGDGEAEDLIAVDLDYTI